MRNRTKVRVKRVRKKPRLLCDPGLCDHCLYIGEGDFLCDCHPHSEYVMVMSDWEPTKFYLHCKFGGKQV